MSQDMNFAGGRCGSGGVVGYNPRPAGIDGDPDCGRYADIARAEIVGRNPVPVSVDRAGPSQSNDRSGVIIHGDIADPVIIGADAVARRGGDVGVIIDGDIPVDAGQGKTRRRGVAAEIAGQNAGGHTAGDGESGT
jgi:hypothetical protein